MGLRLAGIVIESVGGDVGVFAAHTHIVVEDSLAGLKIVLSPVSHELVLAVLEHTALKEVSVVVESVVVEAVGSEHLLAVGQHHIVACRHTLLHAVVVGIAGSERERVALTEAHVAEGLHRVGLLKEVGTVAPELGTLVAEVDTSLGYLRIGVHAIVVKLEFIGMDEINLLILAFGLVLLLRHHRLHAKRKKA